MQPNTVALARGARMLAPLFLAIVILALWHSQALAPPASITIQDNATGGDCAAVGAWSAADKKCTLNQNLAFEGIHGVIIASNGVTLDGNGHTITGNGAINTFGISSNNHDNVTISDVIVQNFQLGVMLSDSDNSLVEKSTLSGNSDAGLYLYLTSQGNTFSELTIENSHTAVHIEETCTNNQVKNSILRNNTYGIRTRQAATSTRIAGNLIETTTSVAIMLETGSNNAVITGNRIYDAAFGGIYLIESSAAEIKGNTVSGSDYNLRLFDLCHNNIVMGNTFQNESTGLGIHVHNSNNNLIVQNNLLGNSTQASVDGASAGNQFSTPDMGGNYWQGPDESCPNTSFDKFCDSARTIETGYADASPWVLRSGWARWDWTWYDDLFASNWVLVANPEGAGADSWVSMWLAGDEQQLVGADGLGAGQIPAGEVMSEQFSGVMDGPLSVVAGSYSDRPVTSQRILWPKGGNSLEEVLGTDAQKLSNRFVWPWYDQQSPGMANWILISNPNTFSVDYSIKLGATVKKTGTIAAGGRDIPQLPGEMGGPVQVEATRTGSSDAAFIMASQRVLSNNGAAFNEVPGIPYSELASDYMWTWYDQLSPGAKNWVLVANPATAAGDLYYQIDIAGGCASWPNVPAGKVCQRGGPLSAGQSAVPQFPGVQNGPVEVTGWDGADPLTSNPKSLIASQRVVWGPSFEEVPGYPAAELSPDYDWTWYDMFSPGVTNWVLVANPAANADVKATISFTDTETGDPVTAEKQLTPGERWYWTSPGSIGGPVHVAGVDPNNSVLKRDVMASQRVLWNGHFNEVLGQAPDS